MNNKLIGVLAAPLLTLMISMPSHADSAPTLCTDGSTSTATGKGACSGHGGVQKGGPSSATTPGVAAAPLAPSTPGASTPDTGGKSTTCVDGTSSMTSGRGACSGHGGVQKPPRSGAGTNPGVAAAPLTPNSPAGASHTTSSPSASTNPGNPGVAPAPLTPPAGSMSHSSASATTASGTPPAGATAKCKDGSYSKAQQHSGACSNHGGVDQWLATSP